MTGGGEVMEHLDLLFAKVGNIEARVDMSSGVMEQMLKDQQLLAKKMEITGHAVAQLTLNQKQEPEPPPSPTHSEVFETQFAKQKRQVEGSSRNFRPQREFPREYGGNTTTRRHSCLKCLFLVLMADTLHMEG